MENFDKKLRYSGYNKQFRVFVIASAVEIVNYKKRFSIENNQPLYRELHTDEMARKAKKNDKKVNWYREGDMNADAPLIINTTMSGKLEKDMREICENSELSGFKVRVTTRGGRKLQLDANSNPLGGKLCKGTKCFPCQNKPADKKSSCRGMGAAYQIDCEDCLKEGKVRRYEGESGNSGRQRVDEHMRLWRAKDKNSVLHYHDMTEHNMNRANYRMKILRKYSDTFERQSND